MFWDCPNVRFIFTDGTPKPKSQPKEKSDEKPKPKQSKQVNKESENEKVLKKIKELDEWHQSKMDWFEEQIKRTSAEKASLGLFKGKQKRILQTVIDSLNDEKAKEVENYENKKRRLKAKLESDLKKLTGI